MQLIFFYLTSCAHSEYCTGQFVVNYGNYMIARKVQYIFIQILSAITSCDNTCSVSFLYFTDLTAICSVIVLELIERQRE